MPVAKKPAKSTGHHTLNRDGQIIKYPRILSTQTVHNRRLYGHVGIRLPVSWHQPESSCHRNPVKVSVEVSVEVPPKAPVEAPVKAHSKSPVKTLAKAPTKAQSLS